MPVPEFNVWEKDNDIHIETSRFHLIYSRQPFDASSILIRVLGGITRHQSEWRYGEPANGLGGTASTLDGANGRIPVGPGVLSRSGYAAIDDSNSMLFDGHGWVATRRLGKERIDGYCFAYGLDYKAAIKALFTISGKQPLLPRWSLGNWWSRYHAYTDKEYLSLMDRFKNAGVPFSVAVIDMDWHYVHDERVRKARMSGWTG